MKKTVLFIFVPIVAVIFCSLALILLSKSVSPYSYVGETESGQTVIVDISSTEYIVQEKVMSNKLPIDHGLTNIENGVFSFKSRVTGRTPDIEVIDIFSITYNGITLHSATSTALVTIYTVLVALCFCVTGFALVKIPKEKDGE